VSKVYEVKMYVHPILKLSDHCFKGTIMFIVRLKLCSLFHGKMSFVTK